jgi:hypothetical protein
MYVTQLREKMQKHRFMLAYRGFFSQEITKALLAGTEKKLLLEGVDSTIKKKVFNVMVECLQNICKHEDDLSSSLFMIGKLLDDYVLYSGNIIMQNKKQSLRNKLEAINSMNLDDLKELYKSLITSNTLSEEGGAGLGLIDIAKKSGSKLDFHFEDMTNQDAYFSLRTVIKSHLESGGASSPLAENANAPISYVYELYKTMASNNIILIYEGDFTQEITKIVLSMTERKFDAEGIDAALKKKVFNVMVESLQNICKHQYSVENSDYVPSIFMIGNNNKEEFSIISGNVIHNNAIPPLQERIDQINTLDKEGLKLLYKQVRLASTISEVGGAGLGFIDMARKSENKLSYSFDKINDRISFFTLMTMVSIKATV